jgi:WD40 repeat protein
VLALDPAGKILASAGWDGMIRLWNVKDGKELRAWQAHDGTVLDVAFSPDGKTLASCSWDHTVKWWEMETGRLQASVEAPDTYHVSFAADGKSLFAGLQTDGKSTLRKVDLETKKDKVLANFDHYIFSLALSADKRNLAIATHGDSKVHIWDTLTEKETLQFETGHQDNMEVFHPNGKLLAVGGAKGDVGLWDWSGKAKVSMAGLKQPVICVAFAPDGKLLVSGGGSWRTPEGTGEIKVWDSATGKELATLGKDLSCVSRLVVTGDGKTCFSGHFDGAIRKWRLPKVPDKK